ncbi:MAG: YcxB family protein [Butyricicoccus pullicaecorum]|nr:YcxB family protein [Butyricicoccus pullicaecorum]
MEQKFLFQVSSMDLDTLVPQVSYGLEKQVELESRKSHPQIWEVTDRFNEADKVPEEVQRKRQKRRGILSAVEWLLGLILLAPALVSDLTVLLLVGAASYAASVVLMWNGGRSRLALLSMVQGIFFTVVGLTDQMGKLLLLGAAGFVVGVLALLFRRRLTQFEKAALRILTRWQNLPEGVRLRAVFSSEGMTLSEEGQQGTAEVPYERFERVIETADLFLMIFAGNVTVLQKKDLTVGEVSEFQSFLREKMEYIAVRKEP